MFEQMSCYSKTQLPSGVRDNILLFLKKRAPIYLGAFLSIAFGVAWEEFLVHHIATKNMILVYSVPSCDGIKHHNKYSINPQLMFVILPDITKASFASLASGMKKSSGYRTSTA